jgi:hypothetical protein
MSLKKLFVVNRNCFVDFGAIWRYVPRSLGLRCLVRDNIGRMFSRQLCARHAARAKNATVCQTQLLLDLWQCQGRAKARRSEPLMLL